MSGGAGGALPGWAWALGVTGATLLAGAVAWSVDPTLGRSPLHRALELAAAASDPGDLLVVRAPVPPDRLDALVPLDRAAVVLGPDAEEAPHRLDAFKRVLDVAPLDARPLRGALGAPVEERAVDGWAVRVRLPAAPRALAGEPRDAGAEVVTRHGARDEPCPLDPDAPAPRYVCPSHPDAPALAAHPVRAWGDLPGLRVAPRGHRTLRVTLPRPRDADLLEALLAPLAPDPSRPAPPALAPLTVTLRAGAYAQPVTVAPDAPQRLTLPLPASDALTLDIPARAFVHVDLALAWFRPLAAPLSPDPEAWAACARRGRALLRRGPDALAGHALRLYARGYAGLACAPDDAERAGPGGEDRP